MAANFYVSAVVARWRPATDDVDAVHSNFDVDAEVLERVAAG